MSITTLPKPYSGAYGVFHFPEDQSCLLTLDRYFLEENYPDVYDREFYPPSMRKSTRFAIQYSVYDDLTECLPRFMMNQFRYIEYLHLNSCSVESLHQVSLFLKPGYALKTLIANVTFSGQDEDDVMGNFYQQNLAASIVLFCETMTTFAKWGLDFDITVELESDEGEDEVEFDKMMRCFWQLFFGFNGEIRFELRNEGYIRGYTRLPRVFRFNTDKGLGAFAFNALHEEGGTRVHFYKNVEPRMRPRGHYFKAFDNLNYAMVKDYSSRHLPGEDDLGMRGVFLNEEFVIIEHYELLFNVNNPNLDPQDRIPVFEREVKRYLDRQVYITGFFAPHGDNVELAKLWLSVRNLFEMLSLLNSSPGLNSLMELALV